jgi:hypothetical protein
MARSQPKGRAMIGMIGAKIVAVLAVAGTMFYGVTYVSHRGEPDGIDSRVERSVAPGMRRRSSSLEFLQRRAAEKDACVSGNMAADCSHQREPVAGASGATPRTLATDETHEPTSTRSLKTSLKRLEKTHRNRKLAASSLPRPNRVAARSRAHQAYAGRQGRPVRSAARRQRSPPAVSLRPRRPTPSRNRNRRRTRCYALR